MMGKSTQVVIGGVTLKVPIVVDEDTTQRIANDVNNRILEIRDRSDRKNTLAFALLAAFGYAAELEVARQESAEEEEKVARAIVEIVERMRALLQPSGDNRPR